MTTFSKLVLISEMYVRTNIRKKGRLKKSDPEIKIQVSD